MDCDLFSFWSKREIQANDIPDIYSRFKYLRTCDTADAREIYQKQLTQYKFADMRQFLPAPSLHKTMPLFSFLLQFRFTLATPYISKDDDLFYVSDNLNSVRKDKVFKTPMISGSSWKGNMRWTAGKELETQAKDDKGVDLRLRFVRLFGHENDAEKKYFNALMPKEFNETYEKAIGLHTNNGSRKGRLHFYPTFFDRIGLDVINPHSRKTKAGTLPIYFETVPAGASGVFTLLYVPFDLLGAPMTNAQKEVTDDLCTVADSLLDMMCKYGFSAKKANAFGLAEEKIEGTFEMAGVTLPVNLAETKMATKKADDANPFAKLKILKTNVAAVNADRARFSSFKELKEIVKKAEQGVRRRENA